MDASGELIDGSEKIAGDYKVLGDTDRGWWCGLVNSHGRK
jgi:hypothetical protein